MEIQFNILRKVRELILKSIDGLSLDQLHEIPKGFSNNIVWNLAHLVVTQQLLHYKLSGLPCLISEELISKFRKGTAPSTRITQQELDQIIELFKELPNQLEEDYQKGKFKNYTEYPTSTGFVLDSIDTAISFNTMHESLHLGVIMSLKKLV